MEANNYPDLNEICRLCLKDNENLLDIFRSELSIPLRIMACTTLEVKESDILPSNICTQCRIQLERFYLFRKKCQISDNKLKKHIRQINSGKISKVFSKKDDEDEEYDDEDFYNSQKFIDSFEKDEQERQKYKEISNKQKNEELHCNDKYTQTESENNIVLINYQSKKIREPNFLIKKSNNIISENVSISSESDNRSPAEEEGELYQKNVDDTDEIIYVIEKEFSDDESEINREPVEVYIEEENETIFMKNDINEVDSHESKDTSDKNRDYTSLIEESSILDDEQDKQKSDEEEIYNITATSENEIHLTETFKKDCNTSMEVDKNEVSYENNTVIENKDAKLFKCHLCPQSFSRVFLLEKHINLHKKNKNKNYVCSVCQKHFAGKSSLDRHSRIHNGEKPYKCDICGKAFIQNEILKRHRYLHFDKKPFVCDHCGQAFIQKNLLQHHITIKHSNKPIPKLFNCDICPKAFVHSSGLSRHLILHSGITYACDFCKKNFTDKSALKRHKETHFRVKS